MPTKLNLVKAQLGIILVLVAVYFLQAATPLRLHPDTVVLLSIAESVEHGGGYLYHGQPTVFPPGYPTMLAGLMKVNMAHVWVIVSLNVLFLVIGLLGVRYILRTEQFSESSVLGVCILSLFSIVFIRYSPIPLTDPLFFGLSIWCLFFMKLTSTRFTLQRALVSVVLVIACICVRRIGIALIPALFWMLFSQPRVRLLYAKRKVTSILAVALIVVALVWVVRITSTLRDFTVSVQASLFSHFTELGEIALNTSSGILPTSGQNMVPVIGIAVLLSILGGILWRRKFGVVEIYFVAYAVIILLWPFYDIRFWLPVIPFLFAYSALALQRLSRSRGREIVLYLLAIYSFLFSVVGASTLVLNTKISFAGSRFADSYPESRYHSTYCAVWHCTDSDTARVDPDALHLLQHYK
jgi:hypothetical protein